MRAPIERQGADRYVKNTTELMIRSGVNPAAAPLTKSAATKLGSPKPAPPKKPMKKT